VRDYDVVVAGAGNAALCAAISAHENGARVLVLERAPEAERGGNSYFTAGGFRFVHEGAEDIASDIIPDMTAEERARIVIPPHSRKFYYDQLMDVTHHQSDEDLVNLLIKRSRATMAWLRSHGIRFVPMYGRQSFLVDGKHHFYGGVNIEAVGGGAGLVEAEMARLQKLGIEIRYGSALIGLVQRPDRVITGAKVRTREGYSEILTKAVILACGGFESNPEMRVRYLGSGWDLCRVRGTRHNMGEGILAALAIGARPYGNWSNCHACEWDISAPPYGDRWVLDNFQKQTPIRSASWSTSTPSASSTKERIIGTLPTRSSAVRSRASRAGRRSRSSTSGRWPCCATSIASSRSPRSSRTPPRGSPSSLSSIRLSSKRP
jgi:tricarballylate dehydrogenase